MKKTATIAGVVVVVVAAATGGAYYVVQRQATERMDAAVAEFRASLPPGSSFNYASASPRLFSRSGHFTDATLVTGDTTFAAATLDVLPGEGRTVRHLEATKVTGKGIDKPASATMSMDRIEVDALTVPAAAKLSDVDPAAITFDHVAAHGLHSDSGKGGHMDAVDVTVDGYGAGKPTTVDVAGFALNLDGAAVDHAGLDHARLRGVWLADLLAAARRGAGGWPHGLEYGLDMTGLSVTAGGKPFVSFASLATASAPSGTDRFETRFDLKDMVVIAMPDLTPGLSDLGYDRFQGNITMHAIADRAAGQMRMDRLDVDAPAMGRLHLALGLDDVPYAQLTPASGRAGGMAFLAMLQARLQSAELTYEDRSLVNKAFAAEATQAGTTPAELKRAAASALNQTGTQLHLGPAVLDPVIAFINDPHRLVVTAKPPQPVVLTNLSGAAADPQRTLGLAVTN